METVVLFNRVWVVLTTGQQLSEVQNYTEAGVIISVCPGNVRILKGACDVQNKTQ